MRWVVLAVLGWWEVVFVGGDLNGIGIRQEDYVGTWQDAHLGMLYACMDSSNHWRAVQQRNGAAFIYFQGSYTLQNNQWILTGTCALAPNQEDYIIQLDPRVIPQEIVMLGGGIRFEGISPFVLFPFKVSVVLPNSTTVWEAWSILGEVLIWHTSLSLVQEWQAEGINYITFLWGQWESIINLLYIGKELKAQLYSFGTVSLLSVQCSQFTNTFYFVSGSVTPDQCGDLSYLWVGNWDLLSNDTTFNSFVSWWVCPTTNGLVSSMGSIQTLSTNGLSAHYFITNSMVPHGATITGSFYDSLDNTIRGLFSFTLFPGLEAFEGTVISPSSTWNVSGRSRSKSTPISYLCSPFYRYSGLWIESQYSTFMYLCVDNDKVTGHYLGKSILLSGSFVSFPNSGFQWILVADTHNTRTGENSTLYLYLEKNTRQQVIYKISLIQNFSYTTAGELFAMSQFKSIDNCSDIPTFWGTFEDDLYSSQVYLCSGNNNTVFGTMNNMTYTFSGTVTDSNVVYGTLYNDGILKFIWTFESNGTIFAQYTDENGVSISTSMKRNSDKVSLSQCNGKIELSSYVGAWGITNLTEKFYLCHISDTYFEGQLGNYFFSGNFLSGILSGTYSKDNITGNWTASVNFEETSLLLTIDNITYIAYSISRDSNAWQCASWQTFWNTKYGINDLSYFGGCFSICFSDEEDFNIIFHNSEIHGNGSIDDLTGGLVGQLGNNVWQFSISITSMKLVMVSIYPYGTTPTLPKAYVPCSTLPSNSSDVLQVHTGCTPYSFQPTVYLKSRNSIGSFPISVRKSGVDITGDGEIAILAAGNVTFILTKEGDQWSSPIELVLTDNTTLDSLRSYYEIFGGNPVSITSSHSFVIYQKQVYVFERKKDKWFKIGTLTPPLPGSQPFYLIKSFGGESICYLEVTWAFYTSYGPTLFYISLYNISSGMVDFDPLDSIMKEDQSSFILSVALDPQWLIYTQLNPQTSQILIYTCPLSTAVFPLTCTFMTLGSVASINDPNTFGLGFSLAVSSEFIFVGYPSSQFNNGTVYVYHYDRIWKLTQTLSPLDSGFHQCFGRNIAVRNGTLMILKALDNTAKPFSMALLSYTLSGGKWVPKYKFVSEDWPSLSAPLNQKRQYTTIPSQDPLESQLIWAMSNHTLFTSSPDLNLVTEGMFLCRDGFWGRNCSNPCNCQQNSTCQNDILGFTCLCLPNTWGVYCQYDCPVCHESQCDDGATGSGRCLCNDTQYGLHCDPCMCVHGSCSNGTFGTGACSCWSGYSGAKCDSPVTFSLEAIISTSVIIPTLLLVLLFVLIYFLCCHKPTENSAMSDLPDEIRWYFDEERIKNESGWTTNLGSFLCKNVEDDKKCSKKMESLLSQLDGMKIGIKKAYVIHNLTLLNNFLGTRVVIQQRHKNSPELFRKVYQPNERRNWVHQNYHLLVQKYGWNTNLELPILPAIHGTEGSIAVSICETGFAALSSLDSGFYGKGIYVTSSCLYALPYYANKKKPAILICLVTPGNILPIIENFKDADSWYGKPVPVGFQSSYVVTSRDGMIASKENISIFDEIVLPSEGQIVPIFLLFIDVTSISKIVVEYQRPIMDPLPKEKLEKSTQ
eukprot:TRINITY_DN2662_c0_g1_i1.p1 TRINITY_DN2662_c0_g1~~TRINITY_DN2662_c0_g1_i1.p1  ORF type:complete len:1596 (-),score=300.24 TRINITY_DN2662_c0_g1_i1:748-5535(-)